MKKNIVIVVLLLFVIGLSGFIVYDKVLKKETPKPKVKVEKTVEVVEPEKENLDAVATVLTEKLEQYNVDYYDNLENVNFSELSDNDKLLAVYMYGMNKNSSMDLKKADVDDYYQNLFGQKLTSYPDLQCWNGDGILYKYNNDINEYQKDCGNNDSCHGHGGLDNHPKSLFVKGSSIQKENDNYIITVTKVFGSNLRDSDGYFYADNKYSVKIEGLNMYANTQRELDTNEKTNVKNYYKKNYEQFKNIKPQYKYTFKKVNNDYFLIKFETIK